MAIVRDDDQRAVVVLQRFGERLAHLDVEVVGRLVEQQQVAASARTISASASRAFSPPENWPTACSGHVAAKIEAAEEVAKLLLARAGSSRADASSGDCVDASCST